jgi:hypothetical protein
MFQNRVPPTSKYPTTASLVIEHPTAPTTPPGTPAKVDLVAALVVVEEVVTALVSVVDVGATAPEVVVEEVESVLPAVDEV